MHEQAGGAQRGKSIGKGLVIGGIVALGGLARIAPALVLGACELLRHGKGAMCVKAMSAALKVQRCLAARLDHLGVRCRDRQGPLAGIGRAKRLKMLVRNALSLRAGSTTRGSSFTRTSWPVFLSLWLTLVSKALGENETAFWSRPSDSQWQRSWSAV